MKNDISNLKPLDFDLIPCAGQVPEDGCPNDQMATYLVDADAEFGMEPTWITVIPQCDSCASNAHRGGFPHAKPISRIN
jgi:hypothetical protein